MATFDDFVEAIGDERSAAGAPRRNLCAWVLAIGLSGCTVSTEDNFPNPPPGPPASCTTVATIDGCNRGSVSYSCTGARPDDGDVNLVCSVGTPSVGGATLYCCAPYGQFYSECTVSTSVPGCVGSSLGFACSGATAPDEADPSLTCSKAAATGGKETYCCTSAAIPPTCAPDPGLGDCTGTAIGFSCAGSATPDEMTASLSCGKAAPNDPDTMAFCCQAR